MEYTLFSANEGAGYISDNPEIDERFKLQEVIFEFGTILPGYENNLGGFFIKPLKYIGRDKKELLFFIGTDNSLSGTKFYYLSINYITPTRFYIQYAPISGRDYNYKNKQWK